MLTVEKIERFNELLKTCVISIDEYVTIINALYINSKDNSMDDVNEQNSLERIAIVICEHFNLTLDQLKSKNRSSNVSRPRQIAMYLMRQYTEFSESEIGEFLGGRDVATVIHCSDKIEREMVDDEMTKELIKAVTKKLSFIEKANET
ncbi:dnaA protein helix-turn-helix [Pseudobutyrivibrio sp. 49]|uniref:helix-turn-helix domain-containing protein n=1 Tax=Pseudobutyrivibrio sp. 49 TaxID=1855344 RepID=UPI00088DE0DB|nr:helix-turn-helix domain-containing protein [Pseudobutyrivibrio sp. 49]SDI56422.1 dnaA protein helix-turn-helix [Pseudobutyrivibrio sp. 49]